MPAIDREIHDIGESHERVVGPNDWPGLRSRRLEWVGLTDAGRGYAMQRPSPPNAHVLVSWGGSGEVWLDGDWRPCSGGQAYFSPPSVPMGFRTIRNQRWQIAWAYLNAAVDEFPRDLRLLSLDVRSFVGALEGLYIQAAQRRRSDRLELWGDLVSSYVSEIASGGERSDPLWEVWSQVDARLSDTWTLRRLAEHAGMSPEKLRLLAIRTTGRSPMRHVTHLRMRRAETLLLSTNSKLQSIAQQVGYDNAFAFSTAFRRWKGESPVSCRKGGLPTLGRTHH